MNFVDLETGDVFVLRWWLDADPILRHYLVANREGVKMSILRLEEGSTRTTEIDARTFDESAERGEIVVVEVMRADQSSFKNHAGHASA